MEEVTHPPKNMKDIAGILGVSTVAVSLALRNSPRVSADLKERVFKLAGNASFKMRNYPQKREKHKKNTSPVWNIGLLVKEDPTDPVAQLIQSTFMRRMTELMLPFEIVPSDQLFAMQKQLSAFDGFLYYYNIWEEHLPLLAGKPQVVAMNDYFDCSFCDNCKVHNVLAGKMAADYLLSRGFRNILILYDEVSAGGIDRHPRLLEFRRRAESGGARTTSLHFSRRKNISFFAQQFAEYLGDCHEPLGLFAFNDITAFQCCSLLELQGRKLEPGKLEMICCDNTFLITQLHTPIPVVELHIARVAKEAVDRLLYRMQNPSDDFVEILFKPDLILPQESSI